MDKKYLIVILTVFCIIYTCKPHKALPDLLPVNLMAPENLSKWQKTPFAQGGFEIQDSLLILSQAMGLSGIRWSGSYPQGNYQLIVEAKRVSGDDFFCGITFPVSGSFCTFIPGGWGGTITGLSNVDWEDASGNVTTLTKSYQNNVWYRIKIIVNKTSIIVFVDNDKVVDLEYIHHQISVKDPMQPSIPLGIAAWKSSAQIRKINLLPIE